MNDLFTEGKAAPRRRAPAAVAVLLSVFVLSSVVIGVVNLAKRSLDQRPRTQETTDIVPASVLDLSGISRAVTAKDRSTFLEYARGDAVTPMALWFDNMGVIGYRYGGFAFEGGEVVNDLDGGTSFTGVVWAGTAKPGGVMLPAPAPGGLERSVVTSTSYTMTVQQDPSSPHGLVVTAMTSIDHAPWDFGPLAAVDSGPVRIVGERGDESNLRAYAPAAREAAAHFSEVFDPEDAARNPAGTFMRDHLVFVSPSEETFDAYFNNSTGDVVRERVGVMNHFPSVNLAPALAGTSLAAAALPATAGTSGVVSVVPFASIDEAGMTRREGAAFVLVHEWTHQYFGFFGGVGVGTGQACAAEGVATMTSAMYHQGVTDWRDASYDAVIASYGDPVEPPDEEALPYGREARRLYATCASGFYYLAEQGNDPFATARGVVVQSTYDPSSRMRSFVSMFDAVPGVGSPREATRLREGWAGWLADHG